MIWMILWNSTEILLCFEIHFPDCRWSMTIRNCLKCHWICILFRIRQSFEKVYDCGTVLWKKCYMPPWLERFDSELAMRQFAAHMFWWGILGVIWPLQFQIIILIFLMMDYNHVNETLCNDQRLGFIFWSVVFVRWCFTIILHVFFLLAFLKSKALTVQRISIHAILVDHAKFFQLGYVMVRWSAAMELMKPIVIAQQLAKKKLSKYGWSLMQFFVLCTLFTLADFRFGVARSHFLILMLVSMFVMESKTA